MITSVTVMTNKEIERRLIELRSSIYKDGWDHNRTRQTLDVILGLMIQLVPPNVISGRMSDQVFGND